MDSLLVEDKPELNITPLVDVMLVLLAILMVTAPTLVYEESVNLPKGSTSKVISRVITLDIKIYADKTISFKNKKYKFQEFVDNFTLQSHTIKKNTVVYLKADQNLKYKDVMFILKVIKESGFLKVSLVTKA